MIEVTLKSNVSGRIIEQLYEARQILALHEEELVSEMTSCDCQPIGETNVVECNCDSEWEDYILTLGATSSNQKCKECYQCDGKGVGLDWGAMKFWECDACDGTGELDSEEN
ncbi:hypothetical protein [Bacillus thuringiensis]|uniref:hypothetical protein n=1 Tax=Bacillus thuringiensis TaxID=1428 RepID=UPI0020D27F07|nr:hypothetical protein [Bacillus thuringiensis]